MNVVKVVKTISVLLAIILMSMGILCTKKYAFNNPLASDYQGNYKLQVQWKNLTTPLRLDTAYYVAFEQGAAPDTFANITVDALDTPFVYSDSAKNVAANMLVLKFKKAFNRKLHIVGNHPNGKETIDSGDVIVNNQYIPKVEFVDTVPAGKGINPVKVTVIAPFDPIHYLFWRSGNAGKPDSQPGANIATLPETITGSVGGRDTLKVWGVSAKGYFSDTLILIRKIGGYVPLFHGIELLSNPMNCGDTLKFKIKFDSLFPSMVRARVWQEGGKYGDTSKLYAYDSTAVIVMKQPLIDTGKVYVNIQLLDSSGAWSTLSIKDSLYMHYTLPALYIRPAIELPINKLMQISVTDSHSVAVTYKWIFAKNKPDTTTIDHFISKLYTAADMDTVTVIGRNAWGVDGKPVIAVIISKYMKYSLSVNDTIFPTNVAARHSILFSVSMDNAQDFAANGGVYNWRIDTGNTKIVDSTAQGLLSMTRKFSDSGIATITVTAFDLLGDTTSIIAHVLINAYRPQCWFNPSVNTTSINRLDTLRLFYHDSNPDSSGTVDTVFWDTTGDGKTPIKRYRDSSFIVKYTSSGDYFVWAWVKDNDGFVSPKQSIKITVASDKPVRSGLIHDTAIFIHATLPVTAQFLPGNAPAAINSYTWHITGVEHPDDITTQTASFSRKFDIAGVDTITVNCVDQFGLTADMPDTFLVVVSSGEPVVQGITPRAAWTNTAVQYTVNCTSVKPQSRIARSHVSWDNGATFTRYDSTSFPHTFTGYGTQRLRLYVVDNDSISSAIVSDSIMVRLAKPVALSVKPDSMVFVKELRHYTITAFDSATGKIDLYFVSVDGVAYSQSNSPTFDWTFTTQGVKYIKAIVRNDRQIFSDTLTDSVMVNIGAPMVTGITPDVSKDSIFVLDVRSFTIKGHDSHGRIDSVKVSWNGAAPFTDSAKAASDAATFTHKFNIADTAIKNIRVKVMNNVGEWSKDSVYAIKVRLGKPVITSIATDTLISKIFMNQPIKFFVHGRDTNGHIDSIRVAWNGDSNFTQTILAKLDTVVFPYTFTSPGPKQIRFRVYDDDVLSRDSVLSVFVHTGKPKVLSFTPDSAVFIRDPYTYTVSALDSNGSVTSYYVSWDGGVFAQATGSGTPGVATLAKTFTAAGKHPVLVYVVDNDGWHSDTLKDTVVARLCAPVITRISIDTLGPNIFVKDNRTLSVSARDTNGFVKKIYFNWDGGALPVDSILIARNTATIDTFIQHMYDTSAAGPKTIKVWARDDDSIVSTSTKDTAITVRLGRPVLWGDKADTLWTVVDSGWDRSYPIHINSFDTNGVNQKLVRFYWQGSGQPFDSSQADQPAIFRKTNTDTVMWTFPNLGTTNQSRTLWIAGRDDDGLLGGRMSGTPFVVFADSAPPAPVTTSDPVTGGRKISWSGKDSKDGNATLYKIIIKKGANPDESVDIVSDFKAGSLYASGGLYDFSYNYLQTGAGIYYYQVIAKDARGSISRSGIGSFSF